MIGLNPYQVCIANLAKRRSIDHEKMMKELDLWMSKEDARLNLDIMLNPFSHNQPDLHLPPPLRRQA